MASSAAKIGRVARQGHTPWALALELTYHAFCE
jgi:hypothetical protein